MKIFELISNIISVLNKGLDVIQTILNVLLESGVDLKEILNSLYYKIK
ncbi:hypothetical protein [Clostridium thailandense]